MALCLALWLGAVPLRAASLPTDLKASLVVVAPGYTAYTAHGHCALRMQCQSEKLDYCFTYGLDDNTQSYLSFFSGHGVGCFSTAYTRDYLADYARQGRQVTEYELNLSLEEKRSLWALLDSELADGTGLPYNYLKTNCSSMCIRAIEQALGRERIEYHALPPVLNGTYRDFVRYISVHRPWISFFWLSILGSEGEAQGELDDKLSPLLLVDALRTATVTDTLGANRPVLTGHATLLVKGDDGRRTTWFTPTVCFALLLAAACMAGFAERRHRLPWMRYADAVLLALHTVVSVLLCYMCFGSSLAGASGNWLVLVFNPLPFVMWLCFRHRRHSARVYVLYAVVLAFMVLITPISAPVDTPHALLFGVLLARCLSHARPVLRPAKGK